MDAFSSSARLAPIANEYCRKQLLLDTTIGHYAATFPCAFWPLLDSFGLRRDCSPTSASLLNETIGPRPLATKIFTHVCSIRQFAAAGDRRRISSYAHLHVVYGPVSDFHLA